MAKQTQKTSDDSTSAQAGRDVVIHQGMSPQQMREILEGLAEQHREFTSIARDIAEDRIADFEDRMIKRFADLTKANPEAFKDPDFQAVLMAGQKGYARNGDAQVADVIVDIIAERSQKNDRDRLQLTLNEAVEVAGRLTRSEFAALSLVFIVRCTFQDGLESAAEFANFFNSKIDPLLEDISKSHSAYQFLEAQRCASISGKPMALSSVLRQYTGLFSRGFTRDELEASLPDGKKDILDNAKCRHSNSDMLMVCLNDSRRFQFNAMNTDDLTKQIVEVDLNVEEKHSLIRMYENTFMGINDIQNLLEPQCPNFERFVGLWFHSPLGDLSLTSIGIAIAHSNLRRLGNIEDNLSVWIE